MLKRDFNGENNKGNIQMSLAKLKITDLYTNKTNL